MADAFGLQYEGLRNKLAQAGGYYEVTLYGVQTGTTNGDLYITGLDSEKPGIPVPPDSSILVEMYFATKFSDDAVEAGVLRFHAARTGDGNVVLGDLVGGAGTVTLEAFSSNAGATGLQATIVPTLDTTNQGIRLVVDQASGTDVAYISGNARIATVLKGQLLPPYSGGAEANSPFGVS